MAIKFGYQGEIYPLITDRKYDYYESNRDLQYEKFLAIYPNSIGDYDLAEIDSFGNFKLLEELSSDSVIVLLDEAAAQQYVQLTENGRGESDGESTPSVFSN